MTTRALFILLLSALFIAGCASAPWADSADAIAFPSPPDKKGIQVQMVDDALALGIHHATLNISLGGLFDLKQQPTSTPFDFEGRRWFIHTPYLQRLDAQIKALSDRGVVIYAILLAYPTHQSDKDALLLHPNARSDGKYTIAAFNTATPEGIALYRALIGLLARRYSTLQSERGRIWGWIVGNEVNSQWLWYNLGPMPLEQAAGEYEIAVRNTQQVVAAHSPGGRCYLSFDHHWNASMPNISDQEAYKGRDFLDAFARIARRRGDFEWHVAHHPYPDNLGNPRTWLDKDAWPTPDSPHITFKNLEVACRYMRRPELVWRGRPRRIILSEQGIHCLKAPDGETLQAAGFAYAWEKVIRQSGIDAMIWHRHVDHSQEGGLRVGLWENKPGSIADPGTKRPIYDLFQKAGTPAWPAAAQFALPIVGLRNWDELTGDSAP